MHVFVGPLRLIYRVAQKKFRYFFGAVTGVNDAAQNRICGAKGGPKNVTSGRFSYGRPETARHGVHVG